MNTRRYRTAVTALSLALLLVCAGAAAQEPAGRTAEMRNKVDGLLWIGDSILIAVDYGGFVNKTAKMQAFRVTDMAELWYTEVPVGNRLRFEGALWVNPAAGVMYLGHGPFSALDLRDGRVLWSIPYDDIGFVHRVEMGTERLLVLGSKTKSGFRIGLPTSPENAERAAQRAGTGGEHLDDPILFAVNRQSGEIAWQYPFEPGKMHKKKKTDFWSATKITYEVREPTQLYVIAADGSAGELTMAEGNVIVQAKHVASLDLATGQERWKIKEDFNGAPVFAEDRILVIKEDRLVALNPADGSELWRSKDKVKSAWPSPDPFLVLEGKIVVNSGGKLRVLDPATGAETLKSQKDIGDYTIFSLLLDESTPLCVFPGKYDLSKDGYTENYRLCCLSLADGSLRWQFEKGKEFQSCDLGPGGCIQVIDKERLWRLDPATGKILCECKLGDAVVLADVPAPTLLGNDGLRCFTPDGKKEAWRYKVKLSDEGVGDAFYTASTLVMPTKKAGIQAIDPNSGTLKWSIEAEKSGLFAASESLTHIALATDKELRVVELEM